MWQKWRDRLWQFRWVSVVIGVPLTALRAVWFFTTQHAWIVFVFALVGVAAGEFVRPAIANALVAGLLAAAATKVILWQAALGRGLLGAQPTYRAMTVRVWLHPYEAMEKFCPSMLWAARAKCAQTAAEAGREYENHLTNRRTISTQNVLDAMASSDQILQSYGYQTLTSRVDADQAYIRADGDCVSNILEQLWTGVLIAKGIKSPFVDGNPEVVIPEFQWRVMTLNYSQAKASGNNLEYTGIVIGKPR